MAKKLDKNFFYGTGRRKSSIARVRLLNGNGKITINGKDIASDVSGNHDLNEVWSTSSHKNSPLSGKNCGDNPDC